MKLMNGYNLICLTIVAFVGCSDEVKQDFSYNIPTLTVGDPVEDLQQFEQRLESLRWEMNVPAVSAAIVKNRKIVWAKGFGYADLENRVPVTATTSYHLASITKSIASTIIMQLVEEGKLDLETPVSEFGIELESSGIVRVRHLFTHTSKGNPGTVFDYDGGRFLLLDQVIEKASGRSFGELLLERIVQPLELTHTAPNLWDEEMCRLWGVNRSQFEQNMAKAYLDDGKTQTIYEFYFGNTRMLQIAYPQIRNDGDVTRSVIVQEFLNGFVFGDAELPDEPVYPLD